MKKIEYSSIKTLLDNTKNRKPILIYLNVTIEKDTKQKTNKKIQTKIVIQVLFLFSF